MSEGFELTVRIGELSRALRDHCFETFVDPTHHFLGLSQLSVLVYELAYIECTLENRAYESQRERLENVIERTRFHRCNGGIYRTMSGHHDANQCLIHLACGFQERDAVHPRHRQVGDDEIKTFVSHQLQCLLSGRRACDGITLLL